jgi:hypothetical protein
VQAIALVFLYFGWRRAPLPHYATGTTRAAG